MVIRCIVVPSTFKCRLKAELFSGAYDVPLTFRTTRPSLMLNALVFAFAVVHFYFAFTVFILYTPLHFFYTVDHRRPYFVGRAIQIWSID